LRHAHGHARHSSDQAQLLAHRIAALEHEKAQNDQRLIAGIQSVYPALAVLSLVRGTYGQNVAIDTGEWAGAIDRKRGASARQAVLLDWPLRS
jgi:hypothetical protein